MGDETVKAAGQVIAHVAGEAYKDIAQPAAKRVGLALESLLKIALSPIQALDWGFEETKEWLEKKVQARLSNTPSEYISSPPNNIAFPAIKNIAISNDSPELRDIYAELLLKALDARTAAQVHPSFVFVVEQLSPQEALALIGLHQTEGALFTDEYALSTGKRTPTIETQFTDYCASIGLPNREQALVWLENLRRLGLLDLRSFPQTEYQPAGHGEHGDWGPSVEASEFRELLITDYGKALVVACTPPSSPQP